MMTDVAIPDIPQSAIGTLSWWGMELSDGKWQMELVCSGFGSNFEWGPFERLWGALDTRLTSDTVRKEEAGV
jgi:hypothetical protein